MEKKELLLKMQQELPNYQIGLHNISLNRYNRLMKIGDKRDKQIALNIDEINEEVIAQQVLEKGLHVTEKQIGLRSTVSFVRCFDNGFLDYNGWRWSSGRCVNIIVAIPYVINYDGVDYFIGDIAQMSSIANNYLFNSDVAREFIYGYYAIDMHNYQPNPSDSLLVINANYKSQDFKLGFSDELEFVSNPCFFGNLDKENQNLVLKRLLTEKKKVLRDLKLVMNYSKFKMLFKSYYEATVIDLTREQGIELSFEKKITTQFK